MKKRCRLYHLVLIVAGVLSIHEPARSEPLPAFNVDPSTVTVSGISSGAYMAHQFHIAYSARVAGAAIIAGGPYNCGGDGFPWNFWKALNQCADYPDLVPFFGPPELTLSINATTAASREGSIDDPVYLRHDRVFLFSGTLDEIVPQSITDVVADYYRDFVIPEHILYIDDVPAGHGMVTDDYGSTCEASEPPFFNDCDYDLAGALLKHLYGPLSPPDDRRAAEVISFDQGDFIDAPTDNGMHSQGRLFVPRACADGAQCRLHIAFHGCQQHQGAIGDTFYTKAGYNEWAETNNIIVLYPQATPFTWAGLPWPNPAGCWDWWGYTGDDHHLQSGKQMTAVSAMIERITGGLMVATKR